MKKYRKNNKTAGGKKLAIKSSNKAEEEASSLLDLLSLPGAMSIASRRDFLKLCGFSFAVSALSSCQSKIGKAVPYIIAPNELTPGEALYYASSYINGSEYCSIIVKTRDGRPIKIEGNPASGITMGGTTARVQASVLDLYDTGRYKLPAKNGVPVQWEAIDAEIINSLTKISFEKGKVVLLTPTIFSPSEEAVIKLFLEKYPGSEWIEYDARSYSAMLEANMDSFGMSVIPDFRFEKADLVLSMGADFLGTWLSPVEYSKRYSTRRDPDGEMCFHYQLESNLSITGSNADRRIGIKPSQELMILQEIYKSITDTAGVELATSEVLSAPINEISERLLAHKGRSLVVSGSNDKVVQLLVNEINSFLGNVGKTILFDSYLRTHRAVDIKMESLVNRMQEGSINALLLWNTNPSYSYYNRTAFSEGLSKVGFTVSLSGAPNETNSLVQYICPDNHYLESWNDAEAKKNYFSLMQPAMSPLFNTRQMADSLLKWSGSELQYYDFINKYWTNNLFKLQSEFSDPVLFFDNVLQKGIFEPAGISGDKPVDQTKTTSLHKNSPLVTTSLAAEDGITEVVFYESVAQGEGRQANNPWLQELPDPVTRINWDNYASVSPLQAGEMGVTDGDIISFEGIEIPVVIQPGQVYRTIGIALGYGRRICGRVGEGVGVDVWQLLSLEKGNISFTKRVNEILKTGRTHIFAQTQTHHSMEGRALVREAVLTDYKVDQTAGNELHALNAEKEASLYKVREYPYHHWGMAIDLSKCTGCANCVIACQAENNIPVVGKEEVIRVHEMHWMRIDRYYSGSDENPEVVFQPVLCQHCDNAPCENVCPVGATNHSSEGLNQMIYNRCFGTRYCNNNCPYKVRRFNWFNFTEAGTLAGNLRDNAGMTEDLRRMVLNPDVTVRSQGVIEKCSFCIQRIQAAKMKAKSDNRPLRTNEIQTACSQSCPSNAIVFGDMNDMDGDLVRLIKSGRRYNLLEELYTKPSVNYLTKIRNNINL